MLQQQVHPDGLLFQRSSQHLETASATGTFNTLTAALGAANLVDALEGDGPFTVFAPSDAAFSGTVETLLKPENRD